jgi:hypothetical protein
MTDTVAIELEGEEIPAIREAARDGALYEAMAKDYDQAAFMRVYQKITDALEEADR